MTTLPPTQTYADDVLTGPSPVVARLRLQIARIAPHFRIALLTGEPGVGKQFIARQLHLAGPNPATPFTLIPAAIFAQSAASPAGTVYLTGIESLPAPSQPLLLKAIRAAGRDTRIIVSTRSDLRAIVSAGRLRTDLFDAVGTLEIRIPPLRDRLQDLEPIATAMLRRQSNPASLSPAAIARLEQCNWSGNLEDLWSLCQKLPRVSTVITDHDLPRLITVAPARSATTRLEEVMQRHVADVLQLCAGNKLRAAELLGISRSTLYRMLDTQTQNIF